MTDSDRVEALRDLLWLRKPLPSAISRIKSFPWDSERELVTLTRADARKAVDSYLAGDLSAKGLEQWSDAVEGRDDVGFEDGSEDLLREFVFRFSSPEIEGPINEAVAAEWKDRLT
jgi:hypothetical protein